ncbi:MAG: hypothetical protein HKP59_08555 [Lutibacter sp.]|uniref:DUF6168 family protein n=1 Tax=Lutibacter sp. TaxID=1925666 RepID=UPI00185502D5|nr:DUF6168 family protein [Lutibacter sp.]MBT8317665.1 hypothetical protein [Lutibacter sp.]NNJ58523.1 hypothetical protein [Lutibacter sp.]
MINTIKPILFFGSKLLAALVVVFCIHLFILNLQQLPLFDNQITASYLVNGFLAFIIFAILYKLRIKYLDLLGFVYMGGSFLKFGIYFIFFNPIFKQNGEVSKLEATSFLIPYLLCLLIETYYLIKLLNKTL